MSRVVVQGTISAAGFASGDRFVIGHWPTSPVGPMGDVMWGTPDGRRILLAPSQDVADFVTAIYSFDDVRVGDLRVQSDGRSTTASGCGIDVHLIGGRKTPIPFPRPLSITRFVERPIARALMGVETWGTSVTGATEWYQSRGWRWVVDGHAVVNGDHLGAPGIVEPALGVGFSEPPTRPAIVEVRVTIDLPEHVTV